MKKKKRKLRKEVIAEAEIIKFEGGEVPEVVFWNCYFWLTEKYPNGLGFELTEEELKFLKEAVIERYLMIIKRDLTFEFVNKPFYRGIERAGINVRRLKNFLKKENMEEKFPFLRRRIKRWLREFLKDWEDNIGKFPHKEELKVLKKELKTLE